MPSGHPADWAQHVAGFMPGRYAVEFCGPAAGLIGWDNGESLSHEAGRRSPSHPRKPVERSPRPGTRPRRGIRQSCDPPPSGARDSGGGRGHSCPGSLVSRRGFHRRGISISRPTVTVSVPRASRPIAGIGPTSSTRRTGGNFRSTPRWCGWYAWVFCRPSGICRPGSGSGSADRLWPRVTSSG